MSDQMCAACHRAAVRQVHCFNGVAFLGHDQLPADDAYLGG
jgi:hypothetical protein